MTEQSTQIRILAVVDRELREQFHGQLTSFGMVSVLVSSAAGLCGALREEQPFDVVLLPASLAETEGWWSIWGELTMLAPKPAIVVYAHTASFRLWSGVLEVGGYDVIVEPLTNEKFKDALLAAAASSSVRMPEE